MFNAVIGIKERFLLVISLEADCPSVLACSAL